MVKISLHNPNFNRFCMIHPCDRLTDGRAGVAAIAYSALSIMLSRARNWWTRWEYEWIEERCVVADESSRVFLQPIRAVDGSDYINASFIDVS